MQKGCEILKLTKENLKETFKAARLAKGINIFVFVLLEAEGMKEVIVIPRESFDFKENFYMNAYTDDLIHVMNKSVVITGLTHGDERALLDLI